MPAPHNSADTPVMRQFLEVKARHPDAVVMFRMGDFYEMFFEDAVAVAPVLDIALTSRDKGVEDLVPMAGVPYHALVVTCAPWSSAASRSPSASSSRTPRMRGAARVPARRSCAATSCGS
ncbi:MAG: hypothetical protein U0168_26240 [Nannocystaceae bacterium]